MARVRFLRYLPPVSWVYGRDWSVNEARRRAYLVDSPRVSHSRSACPDIGSSGRSQSPLPAIRGDPRHAAGNTGIACGFPLPSTQSEDKFLIPLLSYDCFLHKSTDVF